MCGEDRPNSPSVLAAPCITGPLTLSTRTYQMPQDGGPSEFQEKTPVETSLKAVSTQKCLISDSDTTLEGACFLPEEYSGRREHDTAGTTAWASRAERREDGTHGGQPGRTQKEDRTCSQTPHSHGFVLTACRHKYLPQLSGACWGAEATVQKPPEKISRAGRASPETAL